MSSAFVAIVCLLSLDALVVLMLAAGNAWHRKIRIRRVDFLLSHPGSARGVWSECASGERFFHLFVECLDGSRASLADHFEFETAWRRLTLAGIEVQRSEWLPAGARAENP